MTTAPETLPQTPISRKRNWIWKWMLLILLVLFPLFWAFFLWLFPWEALRDRLVYEWHQQVGTSLEIQRVGPTFPPGIRLEGIRIALPPASGTLPIPWMGLYPSWTRIFQGHLGFQFSGTLLGGRFHGVEYPSDQGPAGWVALQGVQLERLPRDLLPRGMEVQGVVQGRAEGTLMPPGGEVVFTLREVVLSGIPFPLGKVQELRLDPVEGRLRIQESRIRVQRLRFQGPDLRGEVRGELRLQQPFTRSRLDLQIRFRPSEQLRASFGALLAFLPGGRDRDGYYRFSLHGSLESPRLGR